MDGSNNLMSDKQRGRLSVKQIAELIGAEIIGDASIVVDSFASLDTATAGCIAYLNEKGYARFLAETSASAVILGQQYAAQCPVTALIVDDPYVAYAHVAQQLHPPELLVAGIHPSAVVSTGADISATAQVDALAVIEAGVKVGEDCYIGPGCILKQGSRIGSGTRLAGAVMVAGMCIIGERCVVQPGVVIGGDGFGYANDRGEWIRIPQTGRVIIGDDVEIGANACIDRGAVKDTVIGNGVIIDNLVQIGHNCVIGDHTAIAGNAGLSGSSIVGKHCMLAGGVGLAGHLELCDGVTVTGMSMVTSSITKPGVYASGLSAQDGREWRKNHARLRNLDKTIRELKTEIRAMQEKLHKL
jgi:UDP-3-O-[3-hydroxymyristoyl] glucosamine N-acyltransferase